MTNFPGVRGKGVVISRPHCGQTVAPSSIMPLQYGHLPNFSGFGPIDNAMRGARGGKNNTNRTHSSESLYPFFSKIFCVITPITTTNIIDIIKERIATAYHLLKYLSTLNSNNITRTLRR
jgi:hypothetical protein